MISQNQRNYIKIHDLSDIEIFTILQSWLQAWQCIDYRLHIISFVGVTNFKNINQIFRNMRKHNIELVVYILI